MKHRLNVALILVALTAVATVAIAAPRIVQKADATPPAWEQSDLVDIGITSAPDAPERSAQLTVTLDDASDSFGNPRLETFEDGAWKLAGIVELAAQEPFFEPAVDGEAWSTMVGYMGGRDLEIPLPQASGKPERVCISILGGDESDELECAPL